MNNTVITIIAATAVVTGAVTVLGYLRQKNFKSAIIKATDQIEGELQLEDIVSYFRNLNLKKDIDTPFIGNCDSNEFKQFTKGQLAPRTGYKLLMIGTYNKQTENVENVKFIYSLGWSERLIETMGDEACVVLN